jgi:hypothetical protein
LTSVFFDSHDLISFYDNSNPSGSQFNARYGNRNITITGTCNGVTKTFTGLIADTCGNNDCNGCCANGDHPITGYLVDMEYYTVMRHFGTTDCADAEHNVQFTINLT